MSRRVNVLIGPEALQREGLHEVPENWEDGLRAAPEPGNFEWWYFDSQFEDGSTAVVTFFTKSMLDRRSRLKPGLSISITRPDGQKLSQTHLVLPADFSSSKERCYVRAGESWVRGDLCVYELHAKTNDLAAHLTFSGLVPPWRPGTGKIYFDNELRRVFGWLPAIPYGKVEGYLTYDGSIHPVKGICYHDHNWGNVGLNEVFTQWYWGRAHLGDYTLIFAEMTTTARYGSQKLPVFMLAKGDQVMVDDGGPLQLEELDFIADPGGRSYPEGLNLGWKDEALQISLKLREPRLIDSFSLLDLLPAWQRLIGQMIANPYYFRFKAEMDLQIDPGSRASMEPVHTRIQGQALYEFVLLR